jgi:DNA-binding SARP family transcriptional activator
VGAVTLLPGEIVMRVPRFYLFGRFRIQCGREMPQGIESHILQDLLAFLLLHRDRAHPRESVASLLWGDCTTAQSKKHLRHALWQVRETLDPYLEHPDGRLLRVEADWVGIDPMAGFWLDVAAFESIYDALKGVPGQELEVKQVEALQAALCIYRGDLLQGCYHDWCLFERERLQNIYLAMLDKLMAHHETQQATEACLEVGARILRLDRASERTHRRLMRAYSAAGNRTAALRQYQRCAAALRQELGVQPGQRTQALYDQIRADNLAPSSTAAVLAPAPEPVASLSQALRRFQQLQAALVDLQHQVQQDVQAMERALK